MSEDCLHEEILQDEESPLNCSDCGEYITFKELKKCILEKQSQKVLVIVDKLNKRADYLVYQKRAVVDIEYVNELFAELFGRKP